MNSVIHKIAMVGLGLTVASAVITPSFATTKVHTSKHHIVAKTAAAAMWPQICPVSGEKITSAKDAVGHSTYKGKKYYFCCPMCKPEFDKDPAKYVAAAAKGKYLAPM
jgi:YHS domain-containing protein